MDQDILLGITPTDIFGNSISFYLQGAAEFSAKFFRQIEMFNDMEWKFQSPRVYIKGAMMFSRFDPSEVF